MSCSSIPCCHPVDALSVLDFMSRSPQLALARAMRWPFVPVVVNVAGRFDGVTNTLPSSLVSGSLQQILPPAQGDLDIAQDIYVESAILRFVDENSGTGVGGPTSNTTFLDVQDYFGTLQNGLLVTFLVRGSPGFPIAPNFTYASAVFDVQAGVWPKPLVFRDGQTPEIVYNLPYSPFATPLDVTTTFRCWQPAGTHFRKMIDAEALSGLAQLGYDVSGLELAPRG